MSDATEQPKEEPKQDYDKIQQQADQFKANAEKAAAELEAVKEEKTAIETELAGRDEKLQELQTRLEEYASTKGVDDIDNLDPAYTDAKVIKVIKTLKADVEEAKGNLKEQQEKISAYEQKETERAATKQKNETIERVLGLCDDEVGPQYRNEAYKMADELVRSGEEKVGDELDAYRLLTKCYKKLAKEKEKSKTPGVTTDTGEGGISVDDSEVKTGTLEEVRADMEKNKGSWT